MERPKKPGTSRSADDIKTATCSIFSIRTWAFHVVTKLHDAYICIV